MLWRSLSYEDMGTGGMRRVTSRSRAGRRLVGVPPLQAVFELRRLKAELQRGASSLPSKPEVYQRPDAWNEPEVAHRPQQDQFAECRPVQVASRDLLAVRIGEMDRPIGLLAGRCVHERHLAGDV